MHPGTITAVRCLSVAIPTSPAGLCCVWEKPRRLRATLLYMRKIMSQKALSLKSTPGNAILQGRRPMTSCHHSEDPRYSLLLIGFGSDGISARPCLPTAPPPACSRLCTAPFFRGGLGVDAGCPKKKTPHMKGKPASFKTRPHGIAL